MLLLASTAHLGYERMDGWMEHQRMLILCNATKNYCAYMKYDDAKIRALSGVVLVNSAAVWFDSLETAAQDNWNQLHTAFLARYTTPEFMKYKHAN